ncbi:hypothetical protein SDC9_94900 [bioreactor metagenome]|uniref:Uncharacterized protein n=1 Tax=bioreactor metagenome TaxID=1076179 RepID=A0A645A5G0_9ZZZZ
MILLDHPLVGTVLGPDVVGTIGTSERIDNGDCLGLRGILIVIAPNSGERYRISDNDPIECTLRGNCCKCSPVIHLVHRGGCPAHSQLLSSDFTGCGGD